MFWKFSKSRRSLSWIVALSLAALRDAVQDLLVEVGVHLLVRVKLFVHPQERSSDLRRIVVRLHQVSDDVADLLRNLFTVVDEPVSHPC